jgi:hypothetical protein
MTQSQETPAVHNSANRQENINRRSRPESNHTENRTATIHPTPKSGF